MVQCVGVVHAGIGERTLLRNNCYVNRVLLLKGILLRFGRLYLAEDKDLLTYGVCFICFKNLTELVKIESCLQHLTISNTK